MELSSSGLHERLVGLNKAELCPQKDKDEHIQVKAVEIHETQEQMVQRCVIIQKDEKGYGLTVSGDNPVFVQSVKEDGAAARAGVQQGDRIIKVNGTLVTQSNHQDVVELIKSGSYVALTLLGKPPGHGRSASVTLQPLNISGSNTSPHTHVCNKLSSPSERITGPQPVDSEKQQQLNNSRILTIKKMLEKEVIYLENLRLEFSKTPSEKIQAEINGAKKRVKTLEEQLHTISGLPFDQIIPKSPKSPPSPSHRSLSEKENRRSVVSPIPGHPSRSLTHQVSAPTLPPKSDQQVTSCSKTGNSIEHGSPTQPEQQKDTLGFRSTVDIQKLALSASLENIEQQFSCRSTTWPQVSHTHTRQSSSPDTLLMHVENMKHQRSTNLKASPAESLTHSHSEASQHVNYRKSQTSDVSGNDTQKTCRHNSSRDSSFGQYDSAIESPTHTPPVTPPEYAEIQYDTGEAFSKTDVSHEEYGTPPENSSLEINLQSVVAKLGQNPSIISMEDDDFLSDSEMGVLEDHGPFNGLWKLVRNPAHLAVFMHYLMSNSNSSSLFFYLITDMYEQGAGKEMKKWAYEIHSSFLVPGAPLKVATVDENILHEIDDVLLNHIEKEDVLRAVFRKARKKACEELNNLLADFRNKRTMGLANIFGPPDYQLEEAMNDKSKELKIIEQLLVPYLENIPDDIENVNEPLAARSLALVTVLKQFGVKSPQALNIIERCPTFVSKEKSRLRFLQRNKKIMFVQGHHFVPQHYYSVTYCNHCQLIIWGVGNQGYQCQHCEMNIHKACVKVVEEHCIGALRNKKDKRRDRMSGIMENIMGKSRKPSQPVPAAIERARKLNEEMNLDGVPGVNEINGAENSPDNGEKLNNDIKGEVKANNEDTFNYNLNVHNDLEKSYLNKKTAIGRSESFRQRRESRPSFRKRSDPNIPRSKSDVDVDDKSNLNNSGSSSNSSLSNRSLDSPCNSSEMVHRTPSTTTDSVPTNSATAANTTTTTTCGPSSHSSTSSTVHSYDDSDLEADVDPPNWQENVQVDVLRLMKPKEKKRQDVINELFHTEKTHIRNLKVLDRLFYKPLLQEQLLPPDFLQLLFPNLEEMLKIHGSFNTKMKMRRKAEAVVGDIGDLMLEMFDGSSGENLKRAAATYCQNQSVALESLKARQKKDTKLSQFLMDAEGHNLCRRLQLKDIIASGFQRLTKYPLLLENIAKYTPPDTEELTSLQRAVDCSKEILVHVDSAVKEAENLHRLLDVQKKLDKSAFEKVDHPIVESFKNLDVTKHKLIHEGPLTWKLNKQKTVDMHVILFEDILVLLQKQDEKYILKFHNANITTGREDTKISYSPILRVYNLLIRNNASDKRGIFLISSSELHAMYELIAATPSEKKIWCRYLTQAVEVNKGQNSVLLKQTELPRMVPDRVPSDDTSADDIEAINNECQKREEFKESRTNDSVELSDTLQSGSTSVDTAASSLSDVSPDNQQNENTVSQKSTEEATNSSDSQPKSQKRLQRVEILKIADGPQLIEPSEVVISQGAVLQTAEPVLTPVERLRRKDQEIIAAIREKEYLVAGILQIPYDEFHHIAEMAEEFTGEKEADELILASIQQANELSLHINESLNLADDVRSATNVEADADKFEHVSSHYAPDASDKFTKLAGISPEKLLKISRSLNRHLSQLLAVVSEAEEERKQLRKELINAKEQIHLLHEAHRHCVVRPQSPGSCSACQSRPNSFISVTSSECVSDITEQQQISDKSIEDASIGDHTVPLSDGGLQVSSDSCQSGENAKLINSDSNVCQNSSECPELNCSDGSNCDSSICPTTDLDCDATVADTSILEHSHSERSHNDLGQNPLSLGTTVEEKQIEPIYF